MSTIIVISLLLGLLLAEILLWALFLRLGLRWAKVKNTTILRSVYTSIFVFILIGLTNMLYLTLPNNYIPASVLLIVDLLITIFIPCFIIIRMFKASFFQAVRTWLPTLLTPLVMIVIVSLIVQTFLIDGFNVPTNAMAPTILGKYCEGICAECGNAHR